MNPGPRRLGDALKAFERRLDRLGRRELLRAAEELALRHGPPLRIRAEELEVASCPRCRARIVATRSGAPTVPFDELPDLGESGAYLVVHGCVYRDDRADDRAEVEARRRPDELGHPAADWQVP